MHSTQQHSEGCFRHLFEELTDPAVKFELVDSGGHSPFDSRPKPGDREEHSSSGNRAKPSDGEPIIIEANDAFTDVFGYESASVIGEPLNDLIVPPGKQQEAKQFDHRTGTGQSNAAVVERQTSDGKRKFLYRGIPYKERYGFAIYADITDELQRQRHLDVLHRVLRHNLRNDLTVILGMAGQIIDRAGDEQIQQAAAKIEETTSELSQLSDEANTIEKVLGGTTSVRAVDLHSLISDVVSDCEQQFETASITAEVPQGLAVSANEKLQIVLRSLIDNAVRHNDSANPRVTVSATKHDATTVDLEVVDNGPGIPAAEQQLIDDDEEITPLNHGSGLGLWLVKWVIDSYGGELAIETPSTGGSVVRIRLNRVDGR